MSIARTALDLLTWKTTTPQTRARNPAPSTDFVDYRSFNTPAYSPTYGQSQNLTGAIDPESVKDAETKVATIYACIRLISTAMSEAPIEEYQRDPAGKGEPVPDSYIRDLLEEPNPEQSGPDFSYTLTAISAICGYALIEGVRNQYTDRLDTIYPRVPTRWQRRELPGGDYVWETTATKNGTTRQVADRDIIVVPYEPHPRLRGYGITPLRIIEREAGIENMLTAYLITFLDRGAIIPFVMTTDQPIYDPAQISRMQANMQQYQAGGAIDRPPVLSGGLKIQNVGNSVEQMAWPDLRGITELKICQGFGVQPHLVGAKDAISNGGLATTELREALRFFQQHTIAPLRARQAGTLTRGLLRPANPDRRRYLAFNTTNVAALQEDRNSAHDRERADMAASGITVDEFRIATGKEELPEGRGRIRLVPFSVIEQSIDADPEPPAPTPAPKAIAKPPTPAAGKFSYPQAAHRWRNPADLDTKALQIRTGALRTNRNRQEQLSRQFEPKMARFFKQQKHRILGDLAKQFEDIERRDIGDIDWETERLRLKQTMEPHYHRTATKAIDDINKLLAPGEAAIWDLANPNVQAVWQQLGQRIVDISETTRLSVARIINDELANGTSIPQLTDRIEHLFEETYSGRARTIARTETQAAYNQASAVGYRQTGEVDEIELHDNPDHDEDYGASDGLTCAQRDGMIVPIDDAEIHIEAEHPNGTLAISPIVRKVDDEGNPIESE